VPTAFYASLNTHRPAAARRADDAAGADQRPRPAIFRRPGARHRFAACRTAPTIRARQRRSSTLGAFYNAKSLYHPIFQVIDQDSPTSAASSVSTGAGAGARSRSAARPAPRHGRCERYVNVDGERGALTFAADQKARTRNLYAELRLRPCER
jgi:iron complex outermembrane receptor protein